MTTLYISGPMSGYKDHNFPAFFRAERDLLSVGYETLNPARNPTQDCWEAYLRLDLTMVCRADGIAVLPDWQNSAGADAEVHVAHILKIPVHTVDHWVDRKEVLT
jgi:hypothetical protein